MNCSTCRFWKDGPYTGTCHRLPPAKSINRICQNYGYFPETYKDDWCGEWQNGLSLKQKLIKIYIAGLNFYNGLKWQFTLWKINKNKPT